MLAYTELTPEAPPITDVRPTADWPTKGEIVLNKMSLIYPGTSEPVLKGRGHAKREGRRVSVNSC